MAQKLDIYDTHLLDPSQTRLKKPRKTGLTMVIDKGLGPYAFLDLLQTAAHYIDFIKLGFGTSLLYTPELLSHKIEMAKEHQVGIYPGGTFLEVALSQQLEDEYFRFVQNTGFEIIEISDGIVNMPLHLRRRLIHQARQLGLSVITEFGKKFPGSRIELEEFQRVVEMDWEAGACYTIIEGRESGKNVGIYDGEGHSDPALIQNLVRSVFEPDRLIWEAPQKEQQIHFIQTLGRDVNLGNIAAQDVYSLESLRRGLRADTLIQEVPSQEILFRRA